jgi:hypothetical protein
MLQLLHRSAGSADYVACRQHRRCCSEQVAVARDYTCVSTMYLCSCGDALLCWLVLLLLLL